MFALNTQPSANGTNDPVQSAAITLQIRFRISMLQVTKEIIIIFKINLYRVRLYQVKQSIQHRKKCCKNIAETLQC